MFDLDAYLARIGLHDGVRPSLAGLHRAHSTAIPFENLDPHRGTPVSLAAPDVERKLVHARRGGYCFEQNLLLKTALQALGNEVDMHLARVRKGGRPGVVRPRGHLVLQVRDADGERWLADVGFGMGTLFEPLPFALGVQAEQLGWRYRLVEDEREGEWVLQEEGTRGWEDLYGFPPRPVPMIDVETINWWVCTNPRSPFVTGLIVGLQHDDGRRTQLGDWEGLALREQTPDGAEVTPVARAELPELLASRFGLPGFALDADGRLRLAPR